jgi:hypothetical protein
MSEEGRLDVLVNNAGISLGKGLIGTSLADFKAVLDVNLTGAFLGMQRCAPAMRRGGGGSIVNIGAAISMTGFYRAAYSASKWGLRGVSKAAALEFAPWKVRVNVVHPGLVHTPMATANSDLYQAIQDAVPTGVPTMPDEIATFVLFLASDACASITGADLPIDGGVAAAGSMTGFARELGLWEEPAALSMLLAIFGVGVSVEDAVLAWGGGVWVLLELAMQFTLALIAANACVSAPRVHRFLDRLAGLPNPERPSQAIALAATIAVLVGYLNWAVSVVGCALFATFLSRRNPKVDVRVLAVTTILAMGTVWHGGFSGSAPLIMATPHNPLIDPSHGAAVVDRLYPVTETLLHPFNLVYMVLIGLTGVLAAVAVHPKRERITFSEAHIEAILPRLPEQEVRGETAIARFESSRLWIWFAAVLLA